MLTVKEIIHFYGTLRNVSNLKKLQTTTLRSFDLEKYGNILVKNLSGGNRRKLNVAVTCFGQSDLVLMDEPTCDMDPVTRSLVYAAIDAVIHQQRSVILTSHTITEIDRVCRRICILRDGKIVAQGAPTVLKALYGRRYLITIFCDTTKRDGVEVDLWQNVKTMEHFMVHSNCMQFTVQVSLDESDGENVRFSSLLNKLYHLAMCHEVKYTVTECLLDQAIDHMFSGSDHND